MDKAFFDGARFDHARFDVYDPKFDDILDQLKKQSARSAAGKTPFIVGKMRVGKFRVGVVDPVFDEMLEKLKKR